MRILYLPNQYSQQRQHEKPSNIYPVRMAMEAQYYRKNSHTVHWSKSSWSKQEINNDLSIHYNKIITEPENLPFLSIPKPDRIFTNAKSYDSGNYKYKPGTHILSADYCWHGKCTFCVEKNKIDRSRRTTSDVIDEIDECYHLGFREVFDDAPTIAVDSWLSEFCEKMIRKKHKPVLGCNMRICNADFKMMKEAGFRMVLFGIESANQQTLDRINKGIKYEQIIPTLKEASEFGLEPHIAVMFGYEWESEKEEIETLKLVHYLLRKGYAKTAQASRYNGVELPSSKPSPKDIYKVAYHPQFWFNQLKDIRNTDDIKYLWLKIKTAMKG